MDSRTDIDVNLIWKHLFGPVFFFFLNKIVGIAINHCVNIVHSEIRKCVLDIESKLTKSTCGIYNIIIEIYEINQLAICRVPMRLNDTPLFVMSAAVSAFNKNVAAAHKFPLLKSFLIRKR